MICLQLFFSFLQIGLFSFGGGYAAMPLIQGQVVTQHGWLSMTEFTDLVTISQMTPGPIAINSATFVGIKIAGIPGALAATIGCILPSCIIVTLIAWAVPEVQKDDSASGNSGVAETGGRGHDCFSRNLDSCNRVLGQYGTDPAAGYRLEPGPDFCHLSVTSEKIPDESYLGHASGRSDECCHVSNYRIKLHKSRQTCRSREA